MELVKISSKKCSELINMFRMKNMFIIKNMLGTQNNGKFAKLAIKQVHSCKGIIVFR
jgi:hypothetical protein